MNNKRIGVCSKCNETKEIRDHHYLGYEGDNINKTLPYCRSCDFKEHIKARKEGKHFLSIEQIKTLKIEDKTHDRLSTYGHKNETFDEIINRLLNEVTRIKPEDYWNEENIIKELRKNGKT